MNKKEFNDHIICASNVEEFGNIIIENEPVKLTIGDALAVFSYYARNEFKKIKLEFKEVLDSNNITGEKYTLTMRLKSPGSIFFHTLINNFFLEDMIDIHGFRFLTKTLEDTYNIAEILIRKYGLASCKSHEWEEHERQGFMDWITNPRPNGFRSLEYFLNRQEDTPLNIQGRTYKIENEIEEGLAAHKFYKRRQLIDFQLKCLQDEEFRNRKYEHTNRLINSFLRGYYNTDDIENKKFKNVVSKFIIS